MSIYNPRDVSTATIVLASSDCSTPSLATPGYTMDGTADDVQLQAAHDALSHGEHLHLLRGTYNMASEFTITKQLLITGDNAIIKAAAGSINLFHYDLGGPAGWPTDGTRPVGITRGLMFHGGGQSSVVLVLIDDTGFTAFQDIVTYGGDIAFKIYNDASWCESLQWQNVFVQGPGIGFKWTRSGSEASNSVAQQYLRNVEVRNPTQASFYIDTSLAMERSVLEVGGWNDANNGKFLYIDGVFARNTTHFWCEGGNQNQYAVELGSNASVQQVVNIDINWTGTHGEDPIYNPNNKSFMTAAMGPDINSYNNWSGGPGQTQGLIGSENLVRDGNFARGTTEWEAYGVTLALDYAVKRFGPCSLKVTSNGAWANVQQYLDVDVTQYRGRVLTAGCWMRASSGNTLTASRLQFRDSVGYNNSQYIANDDEFHWVTATRLIDSSATTIRVRPYVNYSGTSDTDDVLYVNGVVVVEGPICPPYLPKPISDYDLNVRTVKVEKAHDSDLFDAAGLTDSATIWTQPAGSTLLEAKMVLETQFAASGLTDLDVIMGLAGDNNGLLEFVGNLTSDAVGTIYKTKGAYWNTPGPGGGQYYTHAATAWIAYATAVGANLNTTSAGKVTFYFTYREG